MRSFRASVISIKNLPLQAGCVRVTVLMQLHKREPENWSGGNHLQLEW